MTTASNNRTGTGSKLRRLGLAIIGGLAVVAAAGALMWPAAKPAVEKTLERPDVGAEITRNIARGLKMKTGFTPFRWDSLTASTDYMHCREDPPRPLNELRVKGLRADGSLEAVAQKRLEVKVIAADHLQAAYGEAAREKLDMPVPDGLVLERPSEHAPVMETILKKITIEHTDIYWGKEKSAVGGLQDVKVVSDYDGTTHHISGSGGTFLQEGWPEAAVKTLEVTYNGKAVEIKKGRLVVKTGTVDVTGRIGVQEAPGMDIQMLFHDSAAGPFLQEGMRRKFTGVFDADITLNQKPDEPVKSKGRVRFQSATVKNVPALERAATFTGQEGLRELELDVLTGTFTSAQGKISVKDFVLEAKSLLRVEGDFTVKDGSIDGEFRLGVTKDVLERFPGAIDLVFKESSNGYHWTRLTLKGPLKHPNENLKEQLVSAAKAHYAKKLLAPLLKPGTEVIKAITELY